jgi:uncharacterized protein HemX
VDNEEKQPSHITSPDTDNTNQAIPPSDPIDSSEPSAVPAVVNEQPYPTPQTQPTASHKRGKYVKAVVIIVILLIIICLIGAFAHHRKAKSNLAATPKKQASPTASSSSTTDQNLQSDLNNVKSANDKSSQNISNLNSSLNDQSTMTSVP